MKYTRFLLTTLALLLCTTGLVFAGSDALYGIQVVRQPAVLIEQEGFEIGTAEYWNTRNNFIVELQVEGGWLLKDAQIYAGKESPPTKKDKPLKKDFPCLRDFAADRNSLMIQCSLKEEIDHKWGGDQTRYVAIHADLVMLDDAGEVFAENDFWVLPTTTEDDGERVVSNDILTWEGVNNGGYFTTKFYHPRRGQFIDAPVKGLNYRTPTHVGSTESTEENGSGGFDYFPGETISFSIADVPIGSASADPKISPLDLFPGSDTTFKYDSDDSQLPNPAVNLARVLQTLDCKANQGTGGAIEIEPGTAECFSGLVPEDDGGIKESRFLGRYTDRCAGRIGGDVAVVPTGPR